MGGRREAGTPACRGITPEGDGLDRGGPSEQLIPNDPDERLTYARRIVAQRCLYGVDKNPLAVEMAKLSLWLLTLAKDKPFSSWTTPSGAATRWSASATSSSCGRSQLDGKGDRTRCSTGLDHEPEDRGDRPAAQIETMPANTVEDVERRSGCCEKPRRRRTGSGAPPTC